MSEITQMPGGAVYWKEFGDMSMVVPAGSSQAMAGEAEVEAGVVFVASDNGGYMELNAAAAPGVYIPEFASDTMVPAAQLYARQPVAAVYSMLLDAASGYMDETDEIEMPVVDEELPAAS